MSVIIKIKRGNSTDWTSQNTVLASGEPGYEIDTGRLKIGNGITAWSGLPYTSVVPTGLLAGSGININLGTNGSTATISVSGLNSSNITDFNSSVSGLIQVKNIVGSTGIYVSSTTGTYTISVTGISSLISEEVDDRVAQLLVEGTGVNLTYNDASGTLTIDNLHSEINVLSQEPQGFVNRYDSVVAFNDSTRTFTIQPAVSGGEYDIYVKGIKVAKTGVETVVVGTGTALNYLHFDINPPYSLQNKITEFNFDTDVPIAYIHWNGGISQSTFFGEERHGIRMDSSTHKWIHNTFGIQYIDGLSISNYTLLGDGSSNSHAQISISNGTLYQEDIIIDITDGSGSGVFVQELSPIAYIPTYYHSGSTGQWVRDVATTFPVKYNGTRAQYNLLSGGTWTTPNVTNGRYFATWIVATNDINDPVLAIVGQREDSSLNSAESNNTWSDINLNNIPTQEIRPLYRLIFLTNNSYTNTPKSSLQSILDLRITIQSTVAGVVQNDHGSLFGLADDDHNQYVHINNARTIDAIHTFSNGLSASGLISANSGNFSSLTVNGTGVSVSGHTHTASSITDFNSSVSGLLPSVSGTGYVSSSFANNRYTISVTGLQPSGSYANSTHNHGNITSSGTIGTLSDRVVITTSDGVITTTPLGNGLVFEDEQINIDFPYLNNYYSTLLHNHGNITSSGTIGSNSGLLVITGNSGVLTTTSGITSSYITNFNSSVSGLLPGVTGTGYVSSSFNNNTYIISVTGLQPSGNYTTVGHTHTASNITDFTEAVQDVVGASGFFVGVSGISISYNDVGNTLTIASSGGGGGATISNTGNNRVLTSDGTSTGINAEANMTFDGTSLIVSGNGKFTQLQPTVVSNGSVNGSVSTDVSAGQIFDMTVTGSTTLSNPTNSIDGVTIRWRIRQDGTGGRSVALGSDFQIPSSASSPLPWSTAANAMDILAATYHAGRSKWDVVAFVPGY